MFDPLKYKTRVALYTSVAFVFGLGLASGLGWTSGTFAMPNLTDDPQVDEELVRPAVELSDAFVEIAEVVTPGVVRLTVERPAPTAQRPGGGAPPGIPEPFREFFEPFGGPERDEGEDPPPQEAGGSGFIVSSDGYILTNNHVIQRAEGITVHTKDGQELSAEVVGQDPTTDLAVIKVEADDDLPTLSLGSSDDLRVGDWVLAIGNPGMGGGAAEPLDYTVTQGIVSAMGRPLQIIRQELARQAGSEIAPFAIENFIQTDAVINPGNSGGPLVNTRGQVIGINTAIQSQTGFFMGYGFAVPMDLARRVMEDLIEYGESRRGYLGVSMNDVDRVDAEYYELPNVSGALVETVEPDTPADGAGLQQEDVIVSVDGEPVEGSGDLQLRIGMKRPGEEVVVGFYRDGELQEITVELGQAPLTEEPEPAEPEPDVAQADEILGLEVTELTAEVAQQLGFEEAGGVVIENVAPGSPADQRGITPQLRILTVDGQDVETPDEFRQALEGVSEGDIVSLRLETPDGQQLVRNVMIDNG